MLDKKEIVKTMTYVEALKQGLVNYDDINDFIEEWHEGWTGKELHEFLGMTKEQYFEYVRDDESLKTMFKKGINQ